jgi:tetratricopeptide (TPR) repeat protein
MTFNPNHFTLQYSQSQWAALAGDAATRLGQFGQQAPLSVDAAATLASGDHVGKALDAGLANLSASEGGYAEQIVAATQSSGDRMVAATQASANQISGGMNMLGALSVVQTATLGYGLYKIHDELQSIHSDMNQWGNVFGAIGLGMLTSLQQQTDVSKQILKALDESRRVEARQLIEQGQRNADAGFVDEALDRYTKSLEFDNTDPETWNCLAMLHVRSERMNEAKSSFRKAILFSGDRQPLMLVAVRGFARLLGALGEWDDAATQLLPFSAELMDADHVDLITYLYMSGKWQEGEARARELLDRDLPLLAVLAVDPRLAGEPRERLDTLLTGVFAQYQAWLQDVTTQFATLDAAIRSRDAAAGDDQTGKRPNVLDPVGERATAQGAVAAVLDYLSELVRDGKIEKLSTISSRLQQGLDGFSSAADQARKYVDFRARAASRYEQLRRDERELGKVLKEARDKIFKNENRIGELEAEIGRVQASLREIAVTTGVPVTVGANWIADGSILVGLSFGLGAFLIAAAFMDHYRGAGQTVDILGALQFAGFVVVVTTVTSHVLRTRSARRAEHTKLLALKVISPHWIQVGLPRIARFRASGGEYRAASAPASTATEPDTQ